MSTFSSELKWRKANAYARFSSSDGRLSFLASEPKFIRLDQSDFTVMLMRCQAPNPIYYACFCFAYDNSCSLRGEIAELYTPIQLSKAQ